MRTMFKRISQVMLLAGLVAGLGVVSPASASTAQATGVSIDKLGTDAMGADTKWNLYREFIVLQNDTDGPVNVKGWRTRDEWSKAHPGSSCNMAVFTKQTLPYLQEDGPDADDLADGLWLPKGETITVYSGGAKDTTDNASHHIVLNKTGCGLHGHYLNNNNDTVFLYDGDEVGDDHLVDSKDYNFHGGYVVD